MYFYQVGYGSYEDSGEINLCHHKKFNKKQFEDMVVDAALKAISAEEKNFGEKQGEINEYCLDFLKEKYKEAKNKGETNLSEEDFIKYDMEEKDRRGCNWDRYWTTFSEVYGEVAGIMVEKYGFEYVKYQQRIFVDGWGAICKKDRYFGEKEEILDRIADEYWKRRKKKKIDLV